MSRKLIFLPLITLALAACSDDKPQPAALSCDSPAVIQSIRDQLQETVRREARAFMRNDSRQFVDADKIIAAATQLDISLNNAQTIQDGNRSLCSAELSVGIPNDIADTAAANSPLIYGSSTIADIIGQKILGSRFNYSGNRFSVPLQYLPEGDSVRFEDNTVAQLAQNASAALLPYGVKSLLMIDGKAVSKEEALRMSRSEPFTEPPEADPQDILDNNAAGLEMEDEPLPDSEMDENTEILSPDDAKPKVPALNADDLSDAREQNRQAEGEINHVWNGMEREVQKTLVEEQRNWIKQKSRNCTQSAAGADSQPQAEYLRLQCDTRMTRERIQYLKGYTIN
ncbi:lysozyme inhibitor LprI family protein [Neisseria sp. ZJ106]|uniref:Lysozyme inhibitor LprI family protein n=1 Tax=Neisseria lisongii TaxID=2912188 RepID=A0ABY7RL80_9NEIS|nr:lysozyme inhibitor LprI family protein [Neisseria lisongii]MCF7520552.1 lysozyme inhibitor LprI family protein [Neisseria lisongii]WCL71511.1 lysozyme inhibitor LprI family protein [Neisseria lisongii]